MKVVGNKVQNGPRIGRYRLEAANGMNPTIPFDDAQKKLRPPQINRKEGSARIGFWSLRIHLSGYQASLPVASRRTGVYGITDAVC